MAILVFSLGSLNPLVTEEPVPGNIVFNDIIEGVTMKQELEESTGQEAMVIIEHKEDLHPQIIIEDKHGEPLPMAPRNLAVWACCIRA